MPFHGMFRSWKGQRKSPSPTPCRCRNPVPQYLCIAIQPLFKQWRRMCLFLRQTVPILNSLTIRKFWCSAKIYFIMITSCSVSWNNSEQFCLSLHDGPSDTWRWPSCLPAALSSPYYTFPIPLARFFIIFLPDSLLSWLFSSGHRPVSQCPFQNTYPELGAIFLMQSNHCRRKRNNYFSDFHSLLLWIAFAFFESV